MVTVLKILLPILFVPAFPLRHVAQLLIGSRRQNSVEIAADGSGVTWTGRAGDREKMKSVDGYAILQMESSVAIVVATDGTDAPVALAVPDGRAARRLASHLGVVRSHGGTLVFPVWSGPDPLSALNWKRIRGGPAFKRASFALLCGGFASVVAIAQSIDPYWTIGVVIFLGLPAAVAGVFLLVESWSSLLGEQSAGQMTIDPLKICVDGEFLCYLNDHLTLTITEGPDLEIAAIRIPDGKRLIRPWHVGDRHELELIKATIEAFQARAAEGAPSASPPNPQP